MKSHENREAWSELLRALDDEDTDTAHRLAVKNGFLDEHLNEEKELLQYIFSETKVSKRFNYTYTWVKPCGESGTADTIVQVAREIGATIGQVKNRFQNNEKGSVYFTKGNLKGFSVHRKIKPRSL